MTDTAMISNEKKLISYLNQKDEVKTVEVPSLSDLSWMQMQEWMDEDSANTEGSVIREHYCKKNGASSPSRLRFSSLSNDFAWKCLVNFL